MRNLSRVVTGLAFLLLPLAALGQAPVLVSATITGSNSAPYAYGTYTVQLVDSLGIPDNNPAPFPTQTQFSGALSPVGSLSISLYPNATFLPPSGTTGTLWRFTICSAKSSASNPIINIVQVCYSTNATVTTAGDISLTLSAVAPAVYYFNSLTGALYGALSQTGTTLPAGTLLPAGSVLPTGTTATTVPFSGDSSNQVATNAMIQNALGFSMARFLLAIVGGTYSFDSQGTGALIVVGASGGAVTSIVTIGNPGTGYAIGDLLAIPAGGQIGGNSDAVLRVTGVTAGGITTAQVIYGGTGYNGFAGANTVAAAVGRPFTFVLSGVLTSNVQFIMKFGSFITTSNQWIFANNTTGAFTVNVCEGNASDVCSGGLTVGLAQGTANSRQVIIETDGVSNVYLAGIQNSLDLFFTAAAASNCNQAGVLTSVTSCMPVTVGGVTHFVPVF